MKGKVPFSPFRTFGSPYTLLLHQHVTYLRLKQVPFKVYCSNFSTTLLYSIYYRTRSCFCTLTPNGTTRVQVWQLAETAELDEDVEAIARSTKGEVKYKTASDKEATNDGGAAASGVSTTRTQKMLISKETHPNLHLASWCVVVYACWWLNKTGAMYRYIRGDSLDVLEGYLRFFFIGGVGFARSAAPQFRRLMKHIVRATGASELTAPYMDEHFMRFCTALEAHLRGNPRECFLLGTPHPTLADVTLGAAFSGFFLMDDPPSSTLAEKFPCVTEYAERVTGWRGSTFVGSTDDIDSAKADDTAGQPDTAVRSSAVCNEAEAKKKDTPSTSTQKASSENYPDVVPESLAPCFELMAEVFPFLMSQCASFTAFMAGDGVRTLKKEPLEGEWKGCEGYLLPQLTNIKSLMIVDDDVSSVQARSQDLEVAFLASREVNDDALRNFGRHDDNAETPVKPPASAPSRTVQHHSPPAETARNRPGAAAAAVESWDTMTTAEFPASPNEAAAAAAGKTDEKNVIPPSPASKFEQPMNMRTLDPDDSDFYRAYSTAGRRRLGGEAMSLVGVIPTARHATTAASSAVVSRSSVMESLETLRTMLAKMSCPQYTLTTVFHGRRLYVAVIPEYEVAKVRKTRQEAAAAKAATAKAAT
ncbi:putative mitochondrial hypothetical protein [Leptomonas pyrrhocoris]|uniref:Uncharacterized protein n=1 Tax=Leptomonas pyrrhocoris TaxID=157538 RepID=A0A0M9G3F1_LEPPY|nr:putative mitochondrial hypothetical protein [Leptomonas pyrrhocoris]XP_015660059.1 putative mitochondrial hypothetical protein [Leptomonas pyrrhocoris]KPA81619.1 putative mitochondrial hypothetical protein [Leptomonas pyrrhocoris]KPA81620.1 putative mitochondrial hypothetical protein [Leptomonas pyrrhocoris]|eukprot:XP_015660058.1 putative mitochondrial hypothetical protein [Leptomonas pyrrhocoris]